MRSHVDSLNETQEVFLCVGALIVVAPIEMIKKLFPAECSRSLQQWREYNGIMHCRCICPNYYNRSMVIK